MSEIIFQGEPPYRLLLTRSIEAHGDNHAVHLTLYASILGKGPADAPVKLGLSTSEASQLASDIRRAIEEAQKRHR